MNRGNRTFQDIQFSGGRKKPKEEVVNLTSRRKIYHLWDIWAKFLIVFASVILLVWSNASEPTGGLYAASTIEEREALERQIADLENQINEYEKEAGRYRREGDSLKNEVSRLEAQIASLNLKLKAATLTLRELGGRIDETEFRIVSTEDRLEKNAQALRGLIQEMYKHDTTTMVEVFLKNPSISDFFKDINDISLVQANLRTVITEIKDLKDNLETQKEELVVARSGVQAVREYQEAKKAETDALKGEKNYLLRVTKGEEEKYKELVQETKKSAAEIRSRLFKLLGGGALSFEEAYQYAKLAGGSVGIRPSMLLAVLDRESALGRNVGQCEPEISAHPTRDLPIFRRIVSELKSAGIAPPEPILVSCPISSDGAYGGAMGPSQFIPSTWMIYKNQVESVTGNRPASPWNNADAFVATALYLRDNYDSSGCRAYADENDHILPHQTLSERCASAKYYAGGNWYRFRFVYGDAVVQRADAFDEDIAILEGR